MDSIPVKLITHLKPGLFGSGAAAAAFARQHLEATPAVAACGIPALKALAAPFEQCRFCPTGGIDPEDARDWLALEPVLCVGGSWVAPRGLINRDNMTRLAREAAGLKR